MKFRDVTIFSGHRFSVPQCIQRIDHRATHGWQLRYGGTKLYSDHSNDGSGAAAALDKATKELLRRIATLPAPTTLQRGPSQNKRSQLPPGISGPIVRQRNGSSVRDCSFAVLVPRFGDTPRRRTVYIGTENTYSDEKYATALARAIEIRREAEEAYLRDATRARRADARELKAARAAAKSNGHANVKANGTTS
ncbi:MAG: hypothetical protein KF683_06015 [Rubrivivax sp.]|nr:hypothetical protein [Rubrivivax sp.]